MKIKRYLLSAIAMMLALTLCACVGNTKDPVNDSDTETEIPEKEITLFGGAETYNIIYPETASDGVKSLLPVLVTAIKNASGASVKYATDTSKSTKESPYEILLGVTKRSESSQALEKMNGVGYDVRFIGEKLVITASNDELLTEAVNALIASWAGSSGKIVMSNKTVLTKDASGDVIDLLNNGVFEYKIIVPLSCSDSVYSSATYLSQSLSSITGTIVDICYDEKTPVSDYEICIGKTNRDASTKLYDSLDSVFEYKMILNGRSIAVGSKEEIIIAQAVRMLFSDLYSMLKNSYTGTPVISKTYENSGYISQVAAELPMPEAGYYYGIYQSDDDKFVIYTDNVSENEFEAYVEKLKADGCDIVKEYELVDNRYVLMENEAYSTYVSYLPMKNAMRIYVGPTNTKYNLNSEVTEADAATPAMWQIEVDNKGARSNGGMSYVFQLTDGSFIVIDGGYALDKDADSIYNVLRENTPEGETPVITAWFITHLHIDHYGVLTNFAGKYASETVVKGFYYNFPGVSVNSDSNAISPGSAKMVTTAAKKWKGAVLYDTLHSGMTLGFAGTTIEILCTHEDVYPMTFSDGNDTCTVFKVTMGGQSILILGDARESESITMQNTIPSSKLKADIVQFAHHGYEGCTETLYKMTGAHTVLWPMNIVGYDSDGTTSEVFKYWYNNAMAPNKYVRTSDTVKKVIVAGAGTVKIDLPYTPTGDKIVDYQAIYKERTGNS